MKKPVLLTSIQGHIVIYCKGLYDYKDFFEGLKMIWAVRCGYDYKHTSSDTYTYIANDMFKIIMLCKPERLEHIVETIHRDINPAWYNLLPKDLTPIQYLILQYRNVLSNLQVKDKLTKNYRTLIKLPRPKKATFNRILRGKGKYSDYELITK